MRELTFSAMVRLTGFKKLAFDQKAGGGAVGEKINLLILSET